MKYNIELDFSNYQDKNLLKIIKKIDDLCLKEAFKSNKVSFLYKNISDNTIMSFNPDICFYAASTIKILICLMIIEKVEKKELNMTDKILITMSDLKQDTGIIKYQKEDTYYTLEELLRLTIVESDNTSYLKLVNILGKKNIKKYGKKIKAKHTFEGKDLFGITSSNDMLIYLEQIKKYIDSNNKYSNLFKEWLSNPKEKLIKDKSINNKNYIRKYGSYDIAYHEVGYVEDENPYYLIILTQLNKKNYKEKFINELASLITNFHNIKRELFLFFLFLHIY